MVASSLPWPSGLLDAATRLVWRHHVLAGVGRDFAFRGRRIADHVLWLLTGGTVALRIDGRSATLGAGDLLWIPPERSHEVWIPAGKRPLYGYSFRFAVLAQGEAGFAHAAPLGRATPAQRRLVEDLYADCSLADRWSAQRSQALLHLLYTDLQRGEQAPVAEGLDARQRARLLDLVRSRLHLGLQPADLAAALALSPDWFARRFRRAFGCSPRRWLVEQRLARAAFLLAGGRRDIAGLAAELGYADANFFSRQFTRHYGRPPSAWRG